MKTLHYAIGLPRAGSTLLMNILQQNPDIFTTASCPTPYFVNGCNETATSVIEFIAMEQHVLNECLTEFIRGGMEGWFSKLTNKPVVISKSRAWDNYLNFLFHAYETPKFIVHIRDLRDIICSFEKLSYKYPIWNIGSKNDPVHMKSFEKRIELYCTDIGGNLGRPLMHLPHVYEWMLKKPNNFFLYKSEDFNNNPVQTLKQLYQWIDLPYYEHNLSNIEQSEQYEHDTSYRALVSHRTEKQWRKMEPLHKTMMTKEQSDLVIRHNEWFYKTFYPEIGLSFHNYI
jgi:hypothetical protein